MCLLSPYEVECYEVQSWEPTCVMSEAMWHNLLRIAILAEPISTELRGALFVSIMSFSAWESIVACSIASQAEEDMPDECAALCEAL